MDEEGYKQFLRKNKRAESGLHRYVSCVKEFERFLNKVQNKTEFLKANAEDIEVYKKWKGNQSKSTMNVQLRAISLYFDFISNRPFGASGQIFQKQQQKRVREISRKSFKQTKISKQKKKKIIEWLLEDNNPSIRYRTLRELLNIPKSDPKVKFTKKQISSYQPVKKMLDAMNPDGYWEETHPRSKKIYGKGVNYLADTTHFILSYLAELGMTRENPKIEKAANRYLSLQQPDGDFYKNFSCLYGFNIRTFTLLGFKEDPRLKKTIELMKNSVRDDNGYLCDTHEGKRKRRPVKSCVRGSAKVLYALGELPELWDESFSKKIVEYFLNRKILYKTTDPETYVRSDAGGTIFPFTWRFGLIDVLLPLAKMGYGNDTRMQDAWDVLTYHRNEEGKFKLDGNIKSIYWDVGKRGLANKWITFYAYLCLKYKR